MYSMFLKSNKDVPNAVLLYKHMTVFKDILEML